MAQDALSRLSALAEDRGLRVGVAESLTSGRLASAVGSAESAGDWFAGGVVAYLTDVKERVLGVAPGTDPVSAACAEQLAAGVRELLDADVCVATTGVGGPGPDDGGHPPGTVFLGWATPEGTGHRMLALEGDPRQVLDQTVDAAVEMLIEHVEATTSPQRRGGDTSAG